MQIKKQINVYPRVRRARPVNKTTYDAISVKVVTLHRIFSWKSNVVVDPRQPIVRKFQFVENNQTADICFSSLYLAAISRSCGVQNASVCFYSDFRISFYVLWSEDLFVGISIKINVCELDRKSRKNLTTSFLQHI